MPEFVEVFLELDDVINKNPFKNKEPDFSKLPDFESNKSKLPEPIWDGHQDSIDAYYKTWQIAFSNVFGPTKENGFVSPFIDAAFSGDIFMWDSCFMLMFGKYGDSVFKFQGTLDNFYCKQESDGFISRQISEETGNYKFHRHDPVSTGPEIMAWCEWLYYENYGDKDRLGEIYYPLLCYHRWMKSYRTWRDGSYWSSGWGCGMDNAPRFDMSTVACPEDWRVGTFHHSFMSWIDANAQAIMSCKYLLKMAKELDTTDGVEELEKEVESLTKFVNDNMWSEEDKYYYDLKADGSLLKAKTIASYWVLLADIIPEDRLEGFIAHLENENEFKRPHRVPTLSADHEDFSPRGDYWNGSIWAPTNYMVLRGLTANGEHELAHEIGVNHHENMLKVFLDTGTFWENYAPDYAERGESSSGDFVGWTGIIPITVFIEYVLGIQIMAEKKEIVWRINNLEKHGFNRLPIGRDLYVDLLCEERESLSDKPVVTVKCDEDIKVTVIYDGKSFEI